MKNVTTILLVGMFCTAFQWTNAQSHCKDYHKFNCAPATQKGFKTNGQSRSALLQLGVPTELNIIVYKGQDYRISICKDAKVIGENVLFRLVEMSRDLVEDDLTDADKEYAVRDEAGIQVGITQERTQGQDEALANEYEEVAKVLWDNTEHEMVQEVEFSCTASKRLVIEVIAPGPDEGSESKKKGDLDMGCVGVLIEHMTSPDVGF